jgi:hypothetical protein
MLHLYGGVTGINIFIQFNYPILNINSRNSSTPIVTRLCAGHPGVPFWDGKEIFPFSIALLFDLGVRARFPALPDFLRSSG